MVIKVWNCGPTKSVGLIGHILPRKTIIKSIYPIAIHPSLHVYLDFNRLPTHHDVVMNDTKQRIRRTSEDNNKIYLSIQFPSIHLSMFISTLIECALIMMLSWMILNKESTAHEIIHVEWATHP